MNEKEGDSLTEVSWETISKLAERAAVTYQEVVEGRQGEPETDDSSQPQFNALQMSFEHLMSTLVEMKDSGTDPTSDDPETNGMWEKVGAFLRDHAEVLRKIREGVEQSSPSSALLERYDGEIDTMILQLKVLSGGTLDTHVPSKQ